MIPVAHKLMMEHIVERVRRHGISDLISLLHFQPERIEDHFGAGAALAWLGHEAAA